MPDIKKKKSSKKATNARSLRQTTLFESHSSPVRPPALPKAKSPRVPLTPSRPKRKRDSSESSDIGAISLGPATPAKEVTVDRSSLSPLSRSKRRRPIIESDSDESEGHSSDSTSSAAVAPRKQRLRRLAPRSSDSSGEESRPSRGLLLKKKAQVHSDDDDDAVDEGHMITSRLRIRGKKTAFQKNLERLKRKKSGRPMSSSESSEEEDEEAQSEEDNSKPFKGARPTVDDNLFTEDESGTDSTQSFIVEDDSQAVIAQLPTEFSMRSHDDLAHQFKIIFQFFVHIAVRPSIDRQSFMENQMKHQEYFSFPLRIIRRKLSGLRDSLVASSVWRPKFKKALEDYPSFEVVPLDFAIPSCDACHLGGRMSTLLGRLGGIQYDKVGFADNIRSDSEDTSSEESEKSVTNLRKSKHGFLEFHMGRFCARRVRTYHAFCHWEYHLFSAISSELDDARAARKRRGPVRVTAFAGGKVPPKDPLDADGLCEWLDERGIIDQEWQKLKTMMESAHNLEISAKRGEDD
ncbi:hypothetical protein Agabi119p4_3046 [Agaricus bisporus var. burnettii]|uniref:DUF4211 domain-containing protein n=1 Tax=Agaricus bisporus var. burnettii TaxID=192524 RepID=A0A8H7KJ05_AGABI|nr:hypothetical protein Agabi119p4_3046 [Agaricus bisporus var. burnettii]